MIPCGNCTDALQIALMRLNLKRGDEVIVPAFTYAAAAEAAVLLGLVPVLVDVDERTFNISPEAIAEAITDRTKVIIAVHLLDKAVICIRYWNWLGKMIYMLLKIMRNHWVRNIHSRTEPQERPGR